MSRSRDSHSANAVDVEENHLEKEMDGSEKNTACISVSRTHHPSCSSGLCRKPRDADENSVTATTAATPPDGGWGWMVVAASFSAHFIADGCGFSFGILFTELLEVFGETTGRTAWIGSLFVSMPLICGPIASALTNKYGCRRTTIIGGLIASAGCIASSFVNSVEMMCFTFGIVSGFGLALVFIPAVLVVAFYFEKKRAFATGIAVAGTGIGTFVFAPLTEFLIAEYTWRGALLVIGGLMLNLTVCGALFRPLVDQVETDSSVGGIVHSNAITPATVHCISATQSLDEFAIVLPEGGTVSEFTAPRFVLKSQLCDGDCVLNPMTLSLVELPTYLDATDAVDEMVAVTTDDLSELRHRLRLIHADCELGHAYDELDSIEHRSDPGDRTNNRNSLAVSCRLSTATPVFVYLAPDGSIAGRGGIQGGEASIAMSLLRLHRRRELYYRGGLLRAGFVLASGRSTSCPDIYVHVHHKKRRIRDRIHDFKVAICSGLRTLSVEMFDVSIFRSAIFNYFCVHCMLFHLSFNVPYVYVPVKAASGEISGEISTELGSTLVAIIGISSTIGQVAMGYLNDHPRVNTLHFYIVMTCGAGLCTIAVPLVNTFPFLAVYCAAYGLCISANYVLTTVILVELLGLDKLTNAFGFVSLAGGVSLLVGTPLAGWISDVTGLNNLIFYLFGLVMLLSGLMLILVPCVGRCDRSYNPTTSTIIVCTECHHKPTEEIARGKEEEEKEPDGALGNVGEGDLRTRDKMGVTCRNGKQNGVRVTLADAADVKPNGVLNGVH